MTTLRLAWLFGRRSVSARSTVVLPVVAFAVVTALLLIVAGGAQAFFSWTDDIAGLYQVLAVIALSLLVVPLVALGGSAARLSARRRDDRLASLRLLGATPGLVTALTVIESTVLAVAGAIAGVVLALLASPLVALIPFRGEPLGMSILLSPLWMAVTVAAVGALAALSAVVGLRGVILSPLGVRTRQQAPRVHWVRALIAIGVVVLVAVAMTALRAAADIGIVMVVLAVGFGGSIAVLNLVGPWVLRVAATGQARRARTARRLLAARAVLESPKAAWRQVSGVAMTSFMAVFAGVGVALMDAAGDSGDPQSRLLVGDIRTGVLITVIASFLMVACSAGVNQAAAILDRRDLYVSLDRIGMPVGEMNAARSRAVMSPLRVTAIGSAVTAAVVVFPLTGASLLLSPLTLVSVAACLAAGVLLVWAALRATRPVLRRVLAEPSPSL
ncbi:FtsX-like permease family protein [Leifsonia sp. 21MFCrub1.1]|uniref:FtsX-like permease family protein n=1 Tax=Leifsonia sp. 21MFCrub1.1 TaxID=1798223 RepID=UPI00089288F8|nr:permease [Leifsonia sp. 21MFCrub1.1]SEA44085.1 FtsX-like permease family protein [Leifsonia sp. 21MFCrub1.1]